MDIRLWFGEEGNICGQMFERLIAAASRQSLEEKHPGRRDALQGRRPPRASSQPAPPPSFCLKEVDTSYS